MHLAIWGHTVWKDVATRDECEVLSDLVNRLGSENFGFSDLNRSWLHTPKEFYIGTQLTYLR